MFDKAKQLYDLKRQADQLKRELQAEVLQIERKGVKVTINAALHISSLEYPDNISAKDLTEAVNDSVEEAQKVAAKKMQAQMGSLQDLLRG